MAVKIIRKFTLGLVRAIRSNIIGLGVDVVLFIYYVLVNDIKEQYKAPEINAIKIAAFIVCQTAIFSGRLYTTLDMPKAT